MIVPIEFKKLVRLFLQDSHEGVDSTSDFIDLAVGLMDPVDIPAAKAHLDSILGGEISDEELAEMWKACRPYFWIEKGEIRSFLSDIQSQLEQKRPEV